MFDNLEAGELKETLRIFHEFFGTCLTTLFMPNHTEGGFYLTGGVTDTLVKKGLFDIDSLVKFMIPDVAGIVQKTLGNIGISYVKDEYLTLRGLAVAEENNVETIFNP